MPEQTGKYESVGRFAQVAMIASLVCLAVVFIVALSAAIVYAIHEGWMATIVPALVVAAALLAGLWGVVFYGAIRILVANEFAVSTAAGRLSRAEALLEDQAGSAKKLIELASLSDRAKGLIYRDLEIEAFREIIQEDVMRQDYRTAEALIDAIADKLGYADEATRLRDELADSRRKTLDEKIDAAIDRINRVIERRDWARAFRESHRLLRLFPENPKIASLPERIGKARNEHKRDLLQAYGEAVRKNDVDRSIELLKELDLYLTPQEAAALEESARGVFKAKQHNLAVQFSIMVADQQWTDALSTGKEIIRQFPNSRMAAEVREKMPLLRSRAAEIAAG